MRIFSIAGIFFFLLLGMIGASPAAASTRCYDTQPVLAWNGVTDDSAALVTAINNAIAASGNSAACVQLPEGTGVLCQVNIPNAPNGLKIVGYGIGATTVKPCSSTTNIFVATAGRYLDLGSLSIMPASQQTGGTFFSLSNIYWFNIHDVRSSLGYNFGSFSNNNAGMVCNTDLRTFKGTVMSIAGGYDYQLCSNNHYDDDTPASGQASAYLLVRAVGGLYIGAVDAIHCGNCFTFNPINAGDSIEWVYVDQAAADTCSGFGWWLNAPAGTTIKGFQGQGLWGSSCALSGFRTDGAGTIDGIALTNPRMLTNGNDGMVFASGTNIDITAPIVSGNGTASPGTYQGIAFGPSVPAFSVTGGRIGVQSALPNTQKYNILVNGGTGHQFNITGVNLCGYVTGGILDLSTSSTKMIRNNLCYNAPD